jgi:hypothetical protein
MNTIDVMQHGHRTVMQAIDGLEAGQWEDRRVVGVWSTKDVIAHLASFEAILIDVLTSIQAEDAETPILDELFGAGPAAFNDAQVALRAHHMPGVVLEEYETNVAQALELARAVPQELFRRNGLLAWYGAEYDLDDFIAYMFYGHKREHAAQIKLFRASL